jgi:hypothetical protein
VKDSSKKDLTGSQLKVDQRTIKKRNEKNRKKKKSTKLQLRVEMKKKKIRPRETPSPLTAIQCFLTVSQDEKKKLGEASTGDGTSSLSAKKKLQLVRLLQTTHCRVQHESCSYRRSFGVK